MHGIRTLKPKAIHLSKTPKITSIWLWLKSVGRMGEDIIRIVVLLCKVYGEVIHTTCESTKPSHPLKQKVERQRVFTKKYLQYGADTERWILKMRTSQNSFCLYELFFVKISGYFMYIIQHCFICRPTYSTVSEDPGIEPRTVDFSIDSQTL
jgi:hypothetical protein